MSVSRFLSPEWTADEDRRLVNAVRAGVPFQQMLIPGRSPNSCKNRWQRLSGAQRTPIKIKVEPMCPAALGSRKLLRAQLLAGQHDFKAGDEEAFYAACHSVGLNVREAA